MTTLGLTLALLLQAADPAAPAAAPSAGTTTSVAPPARPAAKPYVPYGQRRGEAGHVPGVPAGQTGAAPGHTGAAPGHTAGAHGNPADLKAYAAGLVDPARDVWQKPDEVVAALGLQPGQVACDVGAGPGYFSLRLAKAVGPAGRVFAVDVEPALLETLRRRLEQGQVGNVTPVLSLGGDPLLPAAACDVVLVVDTYHHFHDGPAYLRRLAAALRPGGRLVNVDFQKRETGVGPPVAHRVAREAFLADAEAAGFSLVTEATFLPHQYLLVLAPAAPPAR